MPSEYPADLVWPWPTIGPGEYPEPYPTLYDAGREVVPCTGALRTSRCCHLDCRGDAKYVARFDCGEWDEECLRCERHGRMAREEHGLRGIWTFRALAAASDGRSDERN